MNLDSREKIRRGQKLKRKRSPEMKRKMSPFTGYTFFFLFFSFPPLFFFFFFARAKVPTILFLHESKTARENSIHHFRFDFPQLRILL